MNEAAPFAADFDELIARVQRWEKHPAPKFWPWIYFVQECPDGPVKIGKTIHAPAKRLASMRTDNPRELRLIGVWRAPGRYERDLHRRFADARITGEWFRPTPELLRFIENPDVDENGELVA